MTSQASQHPETGKGGFKITSTGWIAQRDPSALLPIAAGSRCALAPDGTLVCSYMIQSALGINDFIPMISRSSDGGATWQEQGAIWPRISSTFSIFCSISRSPAGELFLFGIRTPIDTPGETFWNETTQGLKQNELIWAKSLDGGRTWAEPTVIPMGSNGSAEAPGAMCITRSGRWIACYSPYNTFDPAVVVKRDRVMVVFSDDQGRTWQHAEMLNFKDPDSGSAESWVIELADGRLLGAGWRMNHRDGSDFPNPYALSPDGGTTWYPTQSTGIRGQSIALAPLPDGRALMVYNQRKHGDIGVWLAILEVGESGLKIPANQIIWQAAKPVQRGASAEHSEWQDFAFGEPSLTLLQDGSVLVTLWCIQPDGQGIRYVKL